MQGGKRMARVLHFGGAALTFTANAGGAYVATVVAAHQATRADNAQESIQQWVELGLQRENAATLLDRRDPPHRRGRRSVEYCLGLTSPTPRPAEQGILSVMTFFEVRGALFARRRLDPAEMASYLGEEVDIWHTRFISLRDRCAERPGLDPERVEQLGHVIESLQLMIDARSRPSTFADWLPLTMSGESVTGGLVGEADAVFEATIKNANGSASPPPALIVEFYGEANERLGGYLIYPCNRSVPALDAIEVRGRVTTPAGCVRKVIRFADTIGEHYAAIADADRFPGLGRRTRNLDGVSD